MDGRVQFPNGTNNEAAQATIAEIQSQANDFFGIREAPRVSSDCGSGASCVLKNAGVHPALDRLAAQVHKDGNGRIVVTGGDSYWDSASGQAISHSTGTPIPGRGQGSLHNDANKYGRNLGVDIRASELTIKQELIPSYIRKASGGNFKVWVDSTGRLTNKNGVYKDGHVHMTCNAADCFK